MDFKGSVTGAALLRNRSLLGTRIPPREVEHLIIRALPKLDVPIVPAVIRPRTVIPSVVAVSTRRPTQVTPPRPAVPTTVTAKSAPKGRIVRGEG